MDSQQSRSFLTLPGAIIVAAAIIAIAIIWVQKPANTAPTSNTNNDQQAQAITVNLSPVTANDHILGNPNAKIKVVEYSDPSCAYCKLFNPTMYTIMDQNGSSGDISWVYRHFPLDKPDTNGNILHPNAGNESRALECVASIGGNDKFWAYEKKIYEQDTTGTSGLDQKQLPIMAKEIGIDVTKFNTCLSSDQFKDKVEADYKSGVDAGVSGTPTSFLVLSESLDKKSEKYINDSLIQYRIPQEMLYVANSKKIIVMSGALPKTFVVGLINVLLGN